SKQIPNAREHLLAELRLSPDQPDVLLDLGCLLEQAGLATEAMNCFERVIDLTPQDIRGYQNLSLCYYLNGLIEQGMDLSKKVLEMDPHYVPALHNLAYASLQKQNYKQAQNFLTQACQVAPHDCHLSSLKRSIKLMSLLDRATAPFRCIYNFCKNHKSRS
ncbi:MAG: hypothetical protein GY869_04725, partial [Planctomycetes bacterium]|nr:hypothetical protein [Planctomycetota bacterium]